MRWLVLIAALLFAGPALADFEPYGPTMNLRYDEATGIQWLVDHDTSSPFTWRWMTPVKVCAVIMDEEDDRAKVSPDGALYVVEAAGPPLYGAYTNGDNNWNTVLVAGRDCYHIRIYCLTQAVLVSVDGGLTRLGYFAAATASIFDGVLIKQGSVVSVKNAADGSNGTAHITIW